MVLQAYKEFQMVQSEDQPNYFRETVKLRGYEKTVDIYMIIIIYLDNKNLKRSGFLTYKHLIQLGIDNKEYIGRTGEIIIDDMNELAMIKQFLDSRIIAGRMLE